MKASGAILSGGLAAVGLVAAWVTWQRPEAQPDLEDTVWDLGRSELKVIRYEDARREVEVRPEGDSAWVLYTEKPPPPVPLPDGGVAEVAPAEPEKPRTREYRGNDAALNLLDKFTPLRAVRALGQLPEAKLEEVGLAQTPRRIQVATDSGVRTLKVSSEAQGILAPYVMREEDGKVFILRGTTLSDLEFANSRLVDRRLHTFREDQIEQLMITADGKQRGLFRTGQKLSETPDGPPDELATNWHDRIWRLLGVDVLGKGELPAAGAPEVEVRVDYVKDDQRIGYIVLGRSGGEVFASTEHTAGWVRLHGGAAQILEERGKVVSP